MVCLQRLIVVCLVLSIYLSDNRSIAQSQERINITGTVMDAVTGEPLHFANVFLSNTTLGAAADKEGQFVIENVPFGRYQLVATMMGYETQAVEIDLFTFGGEDYLFNLIQKPVPLPSVEVSAKRPRTWKKHLKKFKDIFFGESGNSKKCKIVNPEVLDFHMNDSLECLTASASGPLEIENQALGYRISYYLKEFKQETGSVLWTLVMRHSQS